MKKSKLKWRIIYIAYCIPASLLVPFLLLMQGIYRVSRRMTGFKEYLIGKYKP